MKKFLWPLLVFPLFLSAQKSPFNSEAVFPARHTYSTGDTLRIMTWNVEHLVDELDDPYVNNGRENNGEIKPEKMKLLAQALKMAGADVIVFEEAESANVVEALRDSFFPDLGYQYVADTRSRNWYQNVVILSKLPIGKMISYGNVHTPVVFEEDGESKYQTQNYINTRMWTCELLVDSTYGLYLSGVHLKAGGGNRNEAMRMGQLRYWQKEMEQLLKANPEADIILLGDLNSYRDGNEIKMLLEDSRPLVKLQDPIAPEVNSHPADAPSHRLDYILYNQNLIDQIIPESAQVLSPFSPAEMRTISDHLPLILDLLVP